MNEDMKIKIISAAYGDCNIKDKISVWLLTRKEPDYKRLYDEYRKTALSVHRLNPERCPAEIVEAAFNKVNNESALLRTAAIAVLFSRPALVSAISIALLATVIITFRATKNNDTASYTKQEVIEAEKQVKESLAIVSKVLNRTSKKIGEDILPRNVSKPIKQGIEIINQLFPKGDKNDENS
jgi:hypothetical protein